eukprot:262694_1
MEETDLRLFPNSVHFDPSSSPFGRGIYQKFLFVSSIMGDLFHRSDIANARYATPQTLHQSLASKSPSTDMVTHDSPPCKMQRRPIIHCFRRMPLMSQFV